MAAPNIDEFVDYKAEYMAMIRHAHISGDQVIGLCPFHEDTSDSFSANIKTGQWVCFAGCGSGNFVTFWAKYYHVDTKTALKQICEKYHISTEPKKERKPRKPYTVEEYARDKGMTTEYLAAEWGVLTMTPPNGPTYVYMPYYYSTGELAQERRRFADKDLDFKRDRTSPKKIQALYGEHKLASIQEKYIVIVEGESDVQALWYMGIRCAVGVSGASNFNAQQAGKVAACDKPVAIHIEKDKDGNPDSGGKTFAVAVPRALGAAGLKAAIAVWSCRDIDPECKDPSDILIKYGREKGAQLINAAINAAKRVDMSAWEKPPLTNPPVDLECPKGWSISDEGIYRLDDYHSEKARKAKPEQMENGPELVTATPLLISARIINVRTNTEKVEMSFRVKGKQGYNWKHEIYSRSTVFAARTVIELSNKGCNISSENSKDVVKFLTHLEQANLNTIPIRNATSILGWQDEQTFLPGKPGDMEPDLGDTFQEIYDFGMVKKGTLEDWVAMVKPLRSNRIFRIILAAGFGAPLLRPLSQRSFTLYIWHDTGGGKTISLKTALSIWGDPDELMNNFNSTMNYIERKARLMNDLPLGIDERQQAGSNQRMLDQILYLVANGKSRGRATKDASVKKDERWNTICIATGEEPLTADNSQSGAMRRQLVIHGKPFNSEKEASDMYGKVANCYGSAGPAYIEKLIEHRGELQAIYEEIRSAVDATQNDNLAHVTYASILGLADYLSSIWIFGDDKEEAMKTAKDVASNAASQQDEYNSSSVKRSAPQFILDWIAENEANFRANEFNRGPSYGWYDERTDDLIYINPKSLRDGMERAGYSFNQIKYYLASIGALYTSIRETDAKAFKEFTVQKKRKIKMTNPETGESMEIVQNQRVVKLNLKVIRDSLGTYLVSDMDDSDSEETAEEGCSQAQIGFTDLMPPDPDIPF